MKQKLTLLNSHMIIAKNHFESWMFGILLSFFGAVESQIGVVYCSSKGKSEANTLWNSNAEADIIKILCAFVQQWWWVAALASGMLSFIFNWAGNEKTAEKFKKGTIGIIILFIASLAEPQIRASIEAIGEAIAG